MNASRDLDSRFSEFVATGDSKPLGDVFDATADDLYRLALHLCGAPATAEDLVQATWLKAIQGADTFAPGSPVKPWLTGILHNEARMHFRREKVRSRPLERTEPAADPSVEAERRELIEALDAGIADLPEPYGPVVRLHLRHGLNANAIGEALGRPAGTVRTQLVRGLDRLRAILPASLAGVAAALALPTRGMAAVRTSVLDSAAAAKAVGASSTGLAGATTLWRALAALAALVAVTTGVLLWEPWNGAAPAQAPTDPRVAAVHLGDAEAPSTTDATLPEVRREVPTEVSAPAPAADPSQATLRLSGRVASATGTPIPDAEVFAFRHRASVLLDGSFEHEPLASARSDADGRFTLDTDRGSFELFARAAGWAQLTAVRGTGDAALDEYDSARIVMAPAITIHGQVVAPDGQAIPAQQVELSSSYGTSASLRQDHPSVLLSGAGRFQAKTDDTGAFEFVGPEGARLWTSVEHPDYLGYGESHELSSTELLRITLERGDEIHGRAFLANGRPAGGAEVRLDSATYRKTVADAQGRFSIRGVDLGDDPERGYLSVKHPEAAAFCLSPIPARHHDLTLRLQAPRTLAGRVVDEDDRPVAGAVLRVVGQHLVTPNAMHMEPTTWEWAQGIEKTETDAEGRFAFQRLNEGRYTLQAALENLSEGVIETQVAAGQTDVVVRITAAAIRKAVLTGTITSAADGTPLADADVAVYPAGGGMRREVRTDAEGRFELSGFEPGDYSVNTTAEGFAKRSQVASLALGDNPLEIALVRAVDVTVRVLRADGKPWPSGHAGLDDARGRSVFFQVGAMGMNRLELEEGGTVRFDDAPAELVTLRVAPTNDDEFRLPLDLTHVQDGEVIAVRGGAVVPAVRVSIGVGVATGEVGELDPTTIEGKRRMLQQLQEGLLTSPATEITVTLLDLQGRELSRGTATPVDWNDVADPEQWQRERAMGFRPFRSESRWRGGSMSASAMPTPLPGFDLRGRAEPMLLRVEAEGFETVEQRIDGTTLAPFDEPSRIRPRFVLLRE